MVGGPFLRDRFVSGTQYLEAAFGADINADPATWTWTDITSYAQWDPGVDISLGSPDESVRIVPASLSVVLRNDQANGGYFTVDNALGAYWPDVRENVPIRASLLINISTVIRFQGYATSWSPLRGSGGMRLVRLQAHGVSRRLRQGRATAKSAIRRFFDTVADGPYVYWPLEDGPSATAAASGIDGGTSMIVTGGGEAGAGVRFGVGQGRVQLPSTDYEIAKVGTKSFASLAEGGMLSALVPAVSSTEYSFQLIGFAYPDAAVLPLARWYTPGGVFERYDVSYDPFNSEVRLFGYNAAGSATFLIGSGFEPIDEWEIVVIQSQSGANVITTMYVSRTYVDGLRGSTGGDTRAGTFSLPRSVFLNPDHITADGSAIPGSENLNTDIRVGHLAFWPNVAALISTPTVGSLNGVNGSPWNGWIGESATDRLQRLCDEEGVQIDITGSSDIAMGFQGAKSFLELLEECAAADQGLLYDGLGPGFTYIARSSIYSQDATLTLTSNDLDGESEGDHSDLGRVNVYTATNPDGSSKSFEQPDGDLGTDAIGAYDDAGDHSVYDEADLYQIAAWKVGQGTAVRVRYPRLDVNFAKASTSASAQSWLAIVPFSRVDVTGIQSGTSNPDRSFVTRAWRERWNSKSWPVTLSLVPYEPYAVTLLADTTSPGGDDFLGWLDCDTVTTAASLAAGGTSVVVNVTGQTLVHSAAPNYTDDVDGLYLNIDGMKVRCTAISAPAGSQQTLTLTGAHVLRAVPSGSSVSAWQPARLGL